MADLSPLCVYSVIFKIKYRKCIFHVVLIEYTNLLPKKLVCSTKTEFNSLLTIWMLFNSKWYKDDFKR